MNHILVINTYLKYILSSYWTSILSTTDHQIIAGKGGVKKKKN
jgi:hypothetical protein